jgi:hypothetical protein
VELTNVVLDPGCRSNPISGSGVQQAVGTATISDYTLQFHAACDGKVEVTGPLGRHTQPLDLYQ